MATSGKKLDASFYTRPDVVRLSRALLGKVLCTHFDGKRTEAVITETEAYAGVHDKASHAYGGRRTPRTDVMYWEGGHAYIYLCYGMYSLFNVVTNVKDVPHAVLIRGAVPLTGLDVMLERMKKSKVSSFHLPTLADSAAFRETSTSHHDTLSTLLCFIPQCDI